MKNGDKILCVDAKEIGIPIKEGETYTVKEYAENYVRMTGELPDFKERATEPAVTLVEVPGYFLARRFEVSN